MTEAPAALRVPVVAPLVRHLPETPSAAVQQGRKQVSGFPKAPTRTLVRAAGGREAPTRSFGPPNETGAEAPTLKNQGGGWGLSMDFSQTVKNLKKQARKALR